MGIKERKYCLKGLDDFLLTDSPNLGNSLSVFTPKCPCLCISQVLLYSEHARGLRWSQYIYSAIAIQKQSRIRISQVDDSVVTTSGGPSNKVFSKTVPVCFFLSYSRTKKFVQCGCVHVLLVCLCCFVCHATCLTLQHAHTKSTP